jgi:hypothetical protein
MSEKELEELIYEYGSVTYRLGRLETDERGGDKEYTKNLKRKEEIVKIFDDHFKRNNKKLAAALGL